MEVVTTTVRMIQECLGDAPPDLSQDVSARGLTSVSYTHLNLQHALALSRHLMRNERGERQIVVVTDGEPTAHLLDNGEPFFAWPPVRETLEKTMAEVLRCTKADITINTFALDIERSQFPFVEQIAKVNGGRLFYTCLLYTSRCV